MGERSFGARWWRDSLSIARLAARPVAGTLSLYGALTLPGCAHTYDAPMDDVTAESDDRDDVAMSVDALQLQMDEGWDVGGVGAGLAFPGSSVDDVSGGDGWRQAMTDLTRRLAPTSPALQPYYVPTLFQSLMGTAGQRLRAVMRPIHTPEMDQDFARGLALRQQFAAVDWPRDTALVIDAPGPRAVAVAAALADYFTPVFDFGNWPHPRGVVPAHQTLAATLFYLPIFTAAQPTRAFDAPPMFVLDANRLAPYQDDGQQFDNRYFVRLPSAGQLAALGVKHVLYVSADGTQELDDLNAAFVELCRQGVDVKMVALGDFVRADDAPPLAVAPGGDGDGDAAPEPGAWAFFEPFPPWMEMWWFGAPYWYRGCWWDRGLFWNDYGTYHPRGHGGRPGAGARGPVVIAPPTVHRVPPASHAVAWLPSARPNMFGRISPSARMAAPSGFGQVAVRASRIDGHVTGLGAREAAPVHLAGNGVGHVPSGGGNGVWHPAGGLGGLGRPSGGSGSGVWHTSAGARNGAWHPSGNGGWHPGAGGNTAWHPSAGGRNSVWHASSGGRSIAAPSGSFGRSGSIGRAGGLGGG